VDRRLLAGAMAVWYLLFSFTAFGLGGLRVAFHKALKFLGPFSKF
jgi:hypothetical protein